MFYKTDVKTKESILVDVNMLITVFKTCCDEGRLWNYQQLSTCDPRKLNKAILTFIEDVTNAYIYSSANWDLSHSGTFISFIEAAFDRFAKDYLNPTLPFDFFYNGWYRDFENVFETVIPDEFIGTTWNIWCCRSVPGALILTNYGDYRIHAFAEQAKADKDHPCHRLPMDVLLK